MILALVEHVLIDKSLLFRSQFQPKVQSAGNIAEEICFVDCAVGQSLSRPGKTVTRIPGRNK